LWQVHQAHKEIEEALLDNLDTPGQVTIHFDPCSPDYCPICAVQDCPERSAPFQKQVEWTDELLIAGPPFPSPPAETRAKMIESCAED